MKYNESQVKNLSESFVINDQYKNWGKLNNKDGCTPKTKNRPEQKIGSKMIFFQYSTAADDSIHLRQTIYHLCRPFYHPQWLIITLSG
jgi:hypothetical protein